MNIHAGIDAPSARATAGAAEIRQDIEGLRAVAIVLVLLFHFDLAGFTGGFAGVDVFFVISGYLMTSILLGSRRHYDRTEILLFYRKRAWRIFPAYFATLAAVLVVAYFILIPVDLERLGKSAIPSALFFSNLYFAATANYFATSAVFTPLLHTWSLAVEVQFYLVWPFVVLFARRYGEAGRLALFASLTLVSFAVCLIFGEFASAKAFYWLPTRLWQFGFGAIAFLLLSLPGRWLDLVATEPVALASLAVLVATGLLVDRDTLWPGLAALAPTLATAVLILAGARRAGLATRLLGSAGFRFIGRISYSLYLVHWPVVVFQNCLIPEGPPLPLRLLGLALSLLLAIVMFHAVEAPTRGIGRVGSLRWDAPSSALAAAAALVVAVGGLFALTRGIPGRWDAKVAANNQLIVARTVCRQRAPFAGRTVCVLGDPTAKADVLLWGDSHAQHFADGLDQVLGAQNRAALLVAAGACPPAIGVSIISNAWRRSQRCARQTGVTLDAALKAADIRTVLLAARWALYAENDRFGGEGGQRRFAVDAEHTALDRDTSRRVLEANLLRTVAALKAGGKTIAIIDQVPEMGVEAGRCVTMRLARGGDAGGCDIDRTKVEARQAWSAAMLRRIGGEAGLPILDPKEVLCNAQRCLASIDGRPAYRDDDHINALASRAVVARLARRLPTLQR